MRISLWIHIVAGALALGSGYLALYVAKGGRLHRRSGMIFVYSMVTMGLFGALIAAFRGVWVTVNVPAGVLSAYLVVTALLAVRPPPAALRWIHSALMLVALGIGAMSLAFGFEAVAAGGSRNGVPAFPFFLFGATGTLAGVLDLRMIHAGVLQGTARLRRHLWRMCFALFIAAMSFFLGQAKVIPEPIRIGPLLALPVLAVLITMFYWLRRVRTRRGALSPPINRVVLTDAPRVQ